MIEIETINKMSVASALVMTQNKQAVMPKSMVPDPG